nr:retrotransposon protein, putative, Ty1-copia subclass [Tanacetum cinerariifolium]
MITPSATNSVFRGFFEKQKLTGPNIIDWYRQLRIVLSIKDKLNYLEQPIPPAPVVPVGQHVAPEILVAHTTWIKRSKEIAGLMLMTIEPDIRQNLETLYAHEMLLELKTLFSQQAEQELLQTTRDFHSYKQEEGQSVSSYVLKMKGYIDKLERLGHPVTLGVGLLQLLELLGKKPNTVLSLFQLNIKEEGQSVSSYVLKMKGYIDNLERLGHPVTLGLGETEVGAFSLYVGNGQREAVETFGAFYLCLPSGLEIVLSNCHYAPNNVVYFSAILRDVIFEIDLSNSNINESSIYVVSNKRAKLDLDSALLWHCRLRHNTKKRIEKLQHDGLFDSSDLREFEKCVSCMSGKMARKPYTHQVEKAKDLLGLIHTDVCGPFKIMSRQRASYFVTFTDDFSHHGIIAHRTPPYSSQHNGVSERRNRTLLDMIQPMMHQTTLPKSFWDYALETAIRILNMVPTKKVEKTPYEVWHGKAPKLSYLKFGVNKVLVARNAKFLKNSLINQEASRSLEDLEIIQEEDTHPFIDTSLNHKEDDLEIGEPQSDIVPIRRSTRTRHAPDRMCLYIDAEEHELGDLGETANYKAALLDPESEKWLNAMNVEMQSMKDNELHTMIMRFGKWMSKLLSSMDISMKSIPMLQSVKPYLGRCFAMKDLGEAAYILIIKIYRDRSRQLIGLCQSAYIKKILKRYCMENSKRRSSIMYDVRCTRSDVAFNQNVTSRFQQNPGDIHWTTIKNILKYLRNTKDMFLVYGGELKRELRVSCYTDAGYLMDADDLKSKTGYVFVLNGEAVWVRKFISGLGVVPTIEEPISTYCDNTGAITIANESGFTKGARHFCAKVYYLREVIEYGDIKLEKVHTYDNLADPFTKALAFPKHSEHSRNIRMLPASSLM